MKLPAKLAITSLAIAALANSATANTTATTDPVGFVTTNITASSNGIAYAVSPISPVLLAFSDTSGILSGSITAVGSNTISVDTAGWTSNELSANSVYVLFKSGSLEGLILRVTSNTESTATLDTLSADLVTLGGAVGDTFQLVQGDTLLSMFGTNSDGVTGGNATQFSASQTDRVAIRDTSGVVRSYYFNTDFNQWRRAGTSADQGSVPISPLSGVFYSRIGQTPLSHVTTGSVPVSSVKYLVPTSGVTFFSRFFPVNGTINDYGFQNLPGWTQADRVNTTDSNGVVRSYSWNGTEWRRAGTSANQNSTVVPIGGAVSVSRSGSGPAQLLSVAVPYNLAAQ
jgi:hypothetical protein